MKKQLILITVLVAIALGFSASLLWFKPGPIELQAATWFGEQAKPLPVFELTDHFNQPFNNKSTEGKWHLLFFGYTNCPDICPDTLQMLANMMPHIKDEKVKQQLQLTFVSVDPERDDLQKMKAYVTYFHPDILSVTGDIEKVNTLTDAIGILHYIVKSRDGKVYDVAHSGTLILVDPNGRYMGLFSSPHDSKKIAHDLAMLIE